jgi:hypothetical protein
MWINSYLSNRTQRVESGIPQGSFLGPLLFSIFTNDMPLVLSKASVYMYADDSTLYTSDTTAIEITGTLNKEFRQPCIDTPQTTRSLFTVPKSRTDYGRHTVLHRAMTT